MSKNATYNYNQHTFFLQLKGFARWMEEQQHYAPTTIRPLRNYAGCFLEWAEQQQLETNKVTYTDIMDFIDYCRNSVRSGKDSIGLMNRKLGAVRKYYEYLQYENITTKNPAFGICLKGRKTSVPHNLLDREALGQLYENYHITDQRQHRNKVILGLLTCQALTNEELHQLEVTHVYLKAGKIEVPGGKRRNSRILKLEVHQLLELQEYIHTIRPEILSKIYAYDNKQPFYLPGRKPGKLNKTRLGHQLFISMNGSINIKDSIRHLMKALQQINPQVKSTAQIRQSVIAEWLKTKDLRTVQYMAGHKQVKSTERYQSLHLEDLQEQLNKFHPLG